LVKREWAPEAGDLIWLTFDPQAGREQAGRRPGVVLSPSEYNRRSGLVLACPITSHVKGYPFEVALPPGLPIGGVVLVDHVKGLDWRMRRAEPVGKLPPDALRDLLDRPAPLLGF
jgi:mRNA interferase MazF